MHPKMQIFDGLTGYRCCSVLVFQPFSRDQTSKGEVQQRIIIFTQQVLQMLIGQRRIIFTPLVSLESTNRVGLSRQHGACFRYAPMVRLRVAPNFQCYLRLECCTAFDLYMHHWMISIDSEQQRRLLITVG